MRDGGRPMDKTNKAFYTWVDQDWLKAEDVPSDLRTKIIDLWFRGATVDELVDVFRMPREWIEGFTRTKIPKH